MKITIIGTGYVGLVTGTCFAETGVHVSCVDIDNKKIENLRKGIVPIYEPGLDVMIDKNVEDDRLSFSTSLKESMEGSEAIFIAVGTPPGEDGSADLKYVLAAAREVGQYLQKYAVVITKSTVPVGTAELVKEAVQNELNNRNSKIKFDVASNPEFLKEGNAIDDFLKPDRIVVGVETEKAKKVLRRLYKPFLLNNHPLLFMDITSAELTKYAANSMLATKISFINDIANLCEIVGADIDMVRKGIGSDSRIGNKFIYPGAGYGGSCFPKDVQALIKTAGKNDYSLDILKAVENVNSRQKSVLYQKVYNHFNGALKGKKIVVWGLSFKPNTDDMREAPSLTIIESLLIAGAEVLAYDPVAMDEAKLFLGDSILYGSNPYTILNDADALILVTEWTEFRSPQFDVMEKLMNEKVLFDGRNIYEPSDMKEWGWQYYSIGRKKVSAEK